MKLNLYLKLMRFHKPVGIYLLWFPTAWALWLANAGHPPVTLVLYFLLGTVFMRAAGCVINDIADRHIDKHVKRTKLRPLTNGDVSLIEALSIFVVLLLASCLIVLQLPISCFYLALLAVGVTILYPFCKRFIQAPQLVLGLAFSMGIPMAYCASSVPVDVNTFLLMLINYAWIVSYDTMYAMIDRDDDLRIGVQSTAVLLAHYDCLAIFLLQSFVHLLWFVLAWINHMVLSFVYVWIIAGSILAYQQCLVNTRKPDACLKAFSMNAWYGLVMWIGVMLLEANYY